MIIETADRIKGTEAYYFARKLKELKNLEIAGEVVINLGIGSPDLPPAKSVIEALQQSAELPTAHGYQSYHGLPAFRTAIAAYMHAQYKVDMNPEGEILPLIGSKEGIMHIAQAFLNPGDKMLIPDPVYPTYAAVGKLCQAHVLTYPLDPKNNWSPSLEAIEKLPLDEVKILWLNYPNMPTGTAADREIITHLLTLAKKHRILIVNDNPYNQLFSPPAFSIFQLPGAREVALELHSMSKSHNMAGWRLGWLSGTADYLDMVLKVKSNMDSGMFFALQQAAIKALQLPPDYYSEVRKTYAERRTVAVQIFKNLGVSFEENQGGMFLWGKVPDRHGNGERLSDKILGAARVFITPGFIFGRQGDQYLRISLCSSTTMLSQALEKIKKTVI